MVGPLFDSSFYLTENRLPGLLRVAFGSEDPVTSYQTMLDALNCHHDNAESAGGDELGSATEPEPELTAIEQEIARLLANSDSGPSAPAE